MLKYKNIITISVKGGNYIFMEKLKIKYFTDQIAHLEYIEGKSDWIDLRASEDVELKKGEFKLVPLGIAVKLPEGYEAHIVPRSSTYKNFGIIQANSCGIIDCSYCGDNDMWMMPVIASSGYLRTSRNLYLRKQAIWKGLTGEVLGVQAEVK